VRSTARFASPAPACLIAAALGATLLGATLLGGAAPLAPAASAQAREEAVTGVLQRPGDGSAGQPVAGVDISVHGEDGRLVGRVTSARDGRFRLRLPGPGRYRATLEQDTLPAGVSLRDPERASLEFGIRPGQSRPLLFPLGEGATQRGRGGARALQLVVEGITFGLVIAITAIGLSLIFGTTGLVNFAHGELVTFGALVAWFLNVAVGLHLVPAALIAIVVGGVAGGLLDRGFWRPLRRRGTGLIAMLVISIGLSLLLRYVFLFQFGGRTRPFAQYAVQRALDLGIVAVAPKDLASAALSLSVLAGVAALLQRTRVGKAMRAVADDRSLAESSGVDVERIVSLVWMLGGGLAALGGILYGLTTQVSFQMGFQLLLLMFAGVILGGLGTAYGALVGSLVVGLFVQLSTLVISPDLKNVGALAILVVILLVRPQGILGRVERAG
jgi:branched-chain amino acid transport system permease protein